MITLHIHHNNPEGMFQGDEIAIQEALISLSNQSNYAHENVLEDIKGSFKK